jgi:hypothetical protein
MRLYCTAVGDNTNLGEEGCFCFPAFTPLLVLSPATEFRRPPGDKKLFTIA